MGKTFRVPRVGPLEPHGGFALKGRSDPVLRRGQSIPAPSGRDSFHSAIWARKLSKSRGCPPRLEDGRNPAQIGGYVASGPSGVKCTRVSDNAGRPHG